MVARHALAAAMEAVDPEHLAAVHAGDRSLGIVFCVMNGCVQFSRRFYQEVLENPATASPILFPETVFNSPSSHLAAALGTAAVNHTLIGDDACFLSGLAMARQWLEDHVVDSVLVVAAEELDWLSAEALQLFDRQGITAEGGGALLLEREADPDRRSVRLIHLPEPMVYGPRLSRADAVKQIASELRRHLDASADDRHGATLLIDSRRQHTRLDRPEQKAWADWAHPRCSPVERLGDGFAVTGAWQCAAACEAVAEGIADTVLVSATGGTMQAAGAVFCR